MTKTLIHTALTPDQCRERLAAEIDSDGILTLGGAFGSKRVIGSVDDAGFRLHVRIGYRNSFQTFLTGKFVEDAYGTSVQMRSGMHPFVTAFMCVWMTGAILGGVGATIASMCEILTKGSFVALPLAGLPVLFPLFGVGLVSFGRWLARDEENELAQFVIDKLKAS